MTDQVKAVLQLIQELAVLKNLPRAGWRLRGIKDGESVADHCYRMATTAMLLADILAAEGVEVDTARVMRMALLHEIGEARIGDIPHPATPYLNEELKFQAEQKAVGDMLAGLGEVGQHYRALWDEFETGQTLEARLVRAADKLEMMIQAAQYEAIGYTNLNDFWQNTANMRDFDVHPLVEEIMARLVAARRASANGADQDPEDKP